MRTIELAPEIEAVLRRSTILEDRLLLPESPRLDPKLYKAVNKVIEMAGGVWNKREKAHLFQTNPRERLGATLETGVAKLDLAHASPKLQATAKKKDRQAFFTPPAVADRVVKWAAVCGHVVFEPSAGHGALLDACRTHKAAMLVCNDIDRDYVKVLEEKGYKPSCADFLKLPPAVHPYLRIVMNPPFTKNQDIAHVEHALDSLDRGGVLVAIMSPNVARPRFKSLVDKWAPEVMEIDQGAFKESGTNISVIVVKITKP